MASNRINRINEEIQKELSSLLRTVKDPRVADTMISITRVETTPDLRYTKVYVSFLQADRAADAMKGLKSAAGFLRRQLGSNLKLRYAPEIVWSLDDSITYGAPGAEGMSGSIACASQLAGSIPGSFVPSQFENPANAMAHYCTTGPEIWEQTGGEVDVFVAGVGTGGTITGTGRYLKTKKPSVQIVAVEPAASPLLSKGYAGSHGLQGMGANFVPAVLDTALLDSVCAVTDEEAFAAAKFLAHKYGILSGISAGANYVSAAKIAAENPEKMVVTLLPDAGTRYLSTGIFD